MRLDRQRAFLLSAAYCAVLGAAAYLFLRCLLWWLLPFLLAFAAARAMEPAILLLRRRLHFRRGFSAALLTLFALFLLGGLLALLLSALFTEASALLSRLPALLEALPAQTDALLARLRSCCALCPAPLRAFFEETLSDWTGILTAALGQLVPRLLAALGASVSAVPGLVLAAATTLLAVFFTAASYPTLCAALRKYLPKPARERFVLLCGGVTRSLMHYLRAQLLLCLLTFCQLLAGLHLLGGSFPLLAAFLITLVDALPVFGTGTVLIPWALTELLLGSTARGAALLALYLCTLTVRSIAEPKLVTARSGVPPVASLAAMYLGFRAFGVGGMILLPLLLLLIAQLPVSRAETGAPPSPP